MNIELVYRSVGRSQAYQHDHCLVRRSLAYRHDHCLVVIVGVSALSFGRTVGVAAQSLSVWGSSTVQASGSDSRRIGAIIVWFMVDVVGVSARSVVYSGRRHKE